MTNVFISWSGEKSKLIAEELRRWIPSVLQFAKPYFTPNDIEKGTKWGTEISGKLAESNVGIICLTRENINRPWILFEAGALSKDLKTSKVCSVLFGLDNTDLSGPLTIFQTTEFEKSDFKKMMSTINNSSENQKLNQETFDSVFEKWWPDLERSIQEILEKESKQDHENVRSDRDLLEEILELTRERAYHSSSNTARSQGYQSVVPHELIRDLIKSVEILQTWTIKNPHQKVNDALKVQVDILRYLVDFSDGSPRELVGQVSRLQEIIHSSASF